MSPSDRLPPISPSPGHPERNVHRTDAGREPYLSPRIEPEIEADAEPPFATMPEVTEKELQADTLAFEHVGRRRPRNWGWLKLVVLLAVIGGGAYAGWHKWGADLVAPSGGEVPTVYAPEGPFKVRPETPGGAEIPNRDKDVYALMEKGKGAEAAKGKTESLLPRPEKPLPPPAPRISGPDPNMSDEGSPQLSVEGGESDDDMEMVEAPSDTPPPAPAPTAAPAAAAPAPSAKPPVPGAPPQPATSFAVKPSPDEVRAAQKPAAPPSPPAVKAEDHVAAAPAPTQTAAIGAKAYKIQLGAVRSETAARTEWDKLRKSFPAVLGRLTLTVEKADLGQKGVYYRIQAGPFADRSAADAACHELTKQKTPCLAIRPEG